MLIVSNNPGVEFEPRVYVGLDAPEYLSESLQNDYGEHIKPIIQTEVEMIWNNEAEKKFNAAAALSAKKSSNQQYNMYIVREKQLKIVLIHLFA